MLKYFCFLFIVLFVATGRADPTIVPRLTVYDVPYTTEESQYNPEQLKRNSATLVGMGIATMGLLYLMPSSFTHWDDEDTKHPTKKWWENVSHRPVWDKDDIFLNYVTHPYAGAIYYMGARSAGVSATGSFLYSTVLSTFFWEYGIEAFAERPSIQDLIVTPVVGSLVGEWFYMSKRNILENNGELYGSATLGKTALFLMDPITEISDLIWGSETIKNSPFSFSSQPTFTHGMHLGYGFNLRIDF